MARWLVGLVAGMALACAGGPEAAPPEVTPAEVAPTAAAAPTPAAAPDGPHTPALTVHVTLDAAADAELTKRGEAITVSFMVMDSPMDDGTTREATVELGPHGGDAQIPPVSTAPGKLGVPLENWTVNVYTARKTDEFNLISCDAPGDVGTPPTELRVSCKLI